MYNGKCIDCLPGTSECTAPVTSTCSTGYVIKSGLCTACLSTTTTCESGCLTLGFFTDGN